MKSWFNLSINPFLLTIRLCPVFEFASFFLAAFARAPSKGLPYGGGFLWRAASQSNFREADNEGNSVGDLCCVTRGVSEAPGLGCPFERAANGERGGVLVPTSENMLLRRAGEPAVLFAFPKENLLNIIRVNLVEK